VKEFFIPYKYYSEKFLNRMLFVIGCIALLSESLLTDKPAYKMLLEEAGTTRCPHRG